MDNEALKLEICRLRAQTSFDLQDQKKADELEQIFLQLQAESKLQEEKFWFRGEVWFYWMVLELLYIECRGIYDWPMTEHFTVFDFYLWIIYTNGLKALQVSMSKLAIYLPSDKFAAFFFHMPCLCGYTGL